MSKASRVLIHQPGLVFETTDFGQCWTAGHAEEGLPLQQALPLKQALVEFSFVLPPFSATDPGIYPILTLTRGGVLLRVTYEPSRGWIHCGMDSGPALSLGPAPPEDYTGRVLRAFILVASGGLFPSIEDVEGELPELFGELRLPPSSRAPGLPPWGVAANGNWRITSGTEIEQDQGEKSLPVGFGLSDLRVNLTDRGDDDFGNLPYSGQLDHLVGDPHAPPDWDGKAAEEPLAELLKDFADELVELAGEANTWASRLSGLADDTQRLALGLPED